MLPRVTCNLHVLAINSIITSSNFSNRPKCKFIPTNPSDTTMSQKMITLICYSNGKIVSGRKGICYEGPSPRASIIRAEATFEEFMDKVHQITGYGRLYSGLAVTCRYPVQKEYIALPITSQETMEIAFGAVEAPGNSIELYISHGDEGPSSAPPPIHHETVPSPRGGHEGGDSCEDVGGTDCDDAEAVQRQSLINLNSVPDVLRAAMPSFEQYACQENLSRMMTEEKMEEVEVNVVDQEPGAYIEAPVAEFENASTWADTAVARLWRPFVVASPPTDDLSVYQGQIFGSKQEVVHAVKTFSIRSHHQYYVHKSSPTLLKLKCKGDSECPWSLRRWQIDFMGKKIAVGIGGERRGER